MLISIDPIAGLLLIHVPGVDLSVSVVVRPTHTLVVPVIASGSGSTVTTEAIKQPVGIV